MYPLGYTSIESKGFNMMISAYDINGQEDIPGVVSAIRSSAPAPPGLLESVERVVKAVRDGGDPALLEMTARFDGVKLDPGRLEVTEDARLAAWAALENGARNALEKSAHRISEFARLSLAVDWQAEIAPGVVVGQSWRPLETVGIYVPGGRFPYPSTVLMTGILAREAGAGRIIFCIPPGRDGSDHAVALAATTLVEGCRVFRAGGAQAIAAMAYGTESIPRCRMIAGPGNVYVTAAKRLVSRDVKVDLEAGPSEVAVLGDSSCDASFAVADLTAQLEHDPLAVAVLVSESGDLLEEARALAGGTSGAAGESALPEGTANLVSSVSRELSVEFLNELAPEHLELMVTDPDGVAERITSAGCVFLGPWSAVALGDYVAGPSHVLPTGGTAARLSGLRADDFRRAMNTVAYTMEGFAADSGAARLMAGLEGLRRHEVSLEVRERKAGGGRSA